MSKPITLTKSANAVRDFMLRLAEVLDAPTKAADHWRNELATAIIQVCDESVAYGHAESASPPRAPAEPIDICERLEASASEWADQQDEDAILSREAAAEIRRLRGEIAAMNSLVDRTFDDLGVLREQVKTERRAGIEAAANWHANQRKQWGTAADSPAGTRADIVQVARANIHRVCEDAIRALADKPAPVWTQEDLDAAKTQAKELHDYFANAARKGG